MSVFFAKTLGLLSVLLFAHAMRQRHGMRQDLEAGMTTARMTDAGNGTHATARRVACEHPRHPTFPSCTMGTIGACHGRVRYGYAGRWTSWKTVDGNFPCSNQWFGRDPAVLQAKECVCESRPKPEYYKMERGSCCCPEANRIDTEAECLKAILSLNLNTSTNMWEGTNAFIPGQCSWKKYGAAGQSGNRGNGHWNKLAGSGKARSDLAPICKA